MESLRIKCPSCGIILEVRNSKNEAVKRIVCPHCKKQLAVTFADVLYKNDGVELKIVRMTDGGAKYVLRIMASDKNVLLNGELLHQGDEIVLMQGDKVIIDQTELIFNSGKLEQLSASEKPVKPSMPKAEKPSAPKPQKAEAPKPTKRPSRLPWLLLVLFIIAALVIWRVMTPKSPKLETNVDKDSIAVVLDTVKNKKTEKHQASKKSEKTIKKESTEKKMEKLETIQDDNDDFSLEVRASKGDTNSQYKLGMRWVTSNDCGNVIKGVKYLEAAARKGHSDAQYALGKIYQKGSPACGISKNPSLAHQYMQQAAENGNAKARQYLNSNLD